jgi:PhoPQ-activated pathogenicity-related protein
VAGASKRGWTTWLTPAVDKRVRAIVPIVLDILNIVPNINHHWQAYGSACWLFLHRSFSADCRQTGALR